MRMYESELRYFFSFFSNFYLYHVLFFFFWIPFDSFSLFSVPFTAV